MRYSATLRLHFIQHYMNIQDHSLTKLMDNYYQQPGWQFARTDGGKIKAARWSGDTAPPPKPQQPQKPQRSQKKHGPSTATMRAAAPAAPQPRVFIKKKKTMEPH